MMLSLTYRMYECANCAAQFRIREGEGRRLERQVADGTPTLRVLTLHGREVHRCSIASSRYGAIIPHQGLLTVEHDRDRREPSSLASTDRSPLRAQKPRHTNLCRWAHDD